MKIFHGLGTSYASVGENFIGKKGSVRNRLKELEALGIIISEVEDKYQGRKWYWLTEEGREIAKHLIEIEKIVKKMEKK